jgi:hypothetical protein
MNAIDRLANNYTRQLNLPWPQNIAGKQRVWFAVYPPSEERRIRAKMPHFEAITLESKHGWALVDLTPLLPEWIGNHEYREGIFAEPQHLEANDELEIRASEMVREVCARHDSTSVVALAGLSSLFDFMRVSTLIDRVEDSISGRLLVFFPGEYQRNIYRFMDARDGFNYMAVPITSTESFIQA